MVNQNRNKDLLCACIIFFAAYLFLGNVFIGGKVFSPADILQYMHPWAANAGPDAHVHNSLISDAIVQTYPDRVFRERSFAKGAVPLWSPHILSGSTLPVVFYPINTFVFAIAGVAYGLGVNALIHLWIAGFGVFLLLRFHGTGRAGAVFGALVYMFNGWIVTWLSIVGNIETVAWLPYMFLSYFIVMKKNRMRYGLIGAAAFAMETLGGHLQMALYSAMVLASYPAACFLMSAAVRRVNVRRVLFSFGAVAFILFAGSMLSMISVIPTYELFTLSTRPHVSMPPGNHFAAAIAPYVHIFMPDFFGHPVKNNIIDYYIYSERCIHSGVLPMALAALPIVYRRNAAAAFLTALAVISILMSAGTFPYTLVARISPIFGKFAVSRFGLFFCFSVSLLSGMGLDIILRDKFNRGRHARLCAAILILFSGTAVYLIALNMKLHPQLAGANLWAVESSVILRFLALLAAAGVALFLGAGGHKRLVAALCFAILIPDLFLHGMKFNTASDPDLLFPESKLVDYIKSDPNPPFRFHAFGTSPVLPGSIANGLGMNDVCGYQSLIYRPYSDLLRGFQERDAPGSFMEQSNVTFTTLDPELLGLLNIRYVLTSMPWKLNAPHLEYKGGIERVAVYRFTRFLPRARFVSDYIVPEDGRRQLDVLLEPGFDVKRTVVLGRKPVYLGGGRKLRGAAPRIAIKPSPPDAMRIEVNAPRRSILVLSEISYPGWRMTINGVAAPYMTANHVFRAVPLNAGFYDIRFVFRPFSVFLGALISCATLLLIILVFIINYAIIRWHFRIAGLPENRITGKRD